MKKNKGIINNGGKIEAKNIAVGDHAQINENKHPDHQLQKDSEKHNEILISFKRLIQKNQLQEAISQLIDHLKKRDQKDLLNAVISQSAALTQLDMQTNLQTISQEQIHTQRAKIINALLHIIDNLEE